MSIEQVRQFWDDRPCNIKHSSLPIGCKEYFDQVETKKYKAEPHILTFAEFDKWKNKEVLEIGCGIGTTLISFLRSGANVTAIDLSQNSVNISKERVKVYNYEADIRCEDAEKFTIDKKFDLIFSFGVIHHSPNPSLIIKNMREMIKEDGEIRIMLYSFCSYKVFDVMHQTNQWNMANMRNIIKYYAEAQEGCPIANVYTFKEAEALLSPYFKITKIYKDHIFTWDIENYKQNKFVRNEAFKDIDDETLKNLEETLGWHTLIHATPI